MTLCDLWEQAPPVCIRDRTTPSSIEFDYAGPGGVRRYATRLVPELGPTGEVEFVLALTQDVTDGMTPRKP